MASKNPQRPSTPSDLASLPAIDLPNEGAIDVGALKADDDSVDLSALPEPPSGQSLTSWTAVIRRKKAEAAAAAGPHTPKPVKVDAPSDKDLLDRLAAPRKPGDTKEIPTADLPLFTGPKGYSESDIDLGRVGLGTGTGESEVKFDILYPPSDAAGVMPAPPPLSGVDFRAIKHAEPVDLPLGQSAAEIDLGADTGPVGQGGRSSILDVLLKDAGGADAADLLDYGTDPNKSPRPSPSSRDLDSSKTPANGRHLVDSSPSLGSDEQIDLYAEPAPAPSITDSGTLEISQEALAEQQRKEEAEQSSSVDLSSRPSFHGEFDDVLGTDSRTGLASDSGVDLNLPASEVPGESSMVYAQPKKLDANSAALAAEFEARRKTGEKPKKAARRNEVVPAREKAAPVKTGGYLIHGGIIGLLLGAGGVLAAYFAGALPNRSPIENRLAAADNSVELGKLRQSEEAARKQAEAERARAEQLVAEAKKASADEIQQLKDSKLADAADLKKYSDAAKKAQDDLAAATKAAADAQKAEQAAKAELTNARKAADDAATAKKAADDALAALTKSLQGAGIDPAKPDEAVKKLVADRERAEAIAKDADAKVTEATKKMDALAKDAEAARKSFEEARKTAEDAAKARDASEATVKAVVDRLVKAKFVGDKADGPAVLKGIDDAIKAGSTDATVTIREELAKVRAQAEKADADLAAAKNREAAAIEAATAAKAESQRERDAARAEADAAAAEVARLKAETTRLTRDLEAVKELAELVKTSAATTGPIVKTDPVRVSEQFFGDGLRAYLHGRHAEAEFALRKAIQFRPADARYHYLLGLTLWARKETAGAEAEFEKGRDLEAAGLPGSRPVSLALEGIQGPARAAVEAYRP